MTAYYNEIDPYAAQWLRNLIDAGHIAPGLVDDRSIEDVYPSDLKGFTQCHFFAGIGVWSYALRRAGWPDDRPVWTGSCPCQPFSQAGQGAGFDDERHLWPAWFHLISECSPPVLLGEQVASSDAGPWLDLVQADLEGLGHAFGAVPFPSASVGAPHIRDRLFWVADANGARSLSSPLCGIHRRKEGLGARHGKPQRPGSAGRLEHANHCSDRPQEQATDHWQPQADGPADQPGGPGLPPGQLADAHLDRQPQRGIPIRPGGQEPATAFEPGHGADGGPGPTNGFWRVADWLLCRDGKWRPVSPQPQPLVDGSSESLGRVRPEIIAQVEEEVDAATAQTEGGRAAAMRALLQDLGAQAQRSWPAGGLPGLHEAPFLLAFLRQLQKQGWLLAEGVSLPCAQATSGVLRSVWHKQAIAGAPHRRGLDEQRPNKPADVVCVLSRLLARHASTAWGDAYAAHAETGFPLASGVRSRVGRLRGYGNAINAEAAIAFIEATGLIA